MTVSPGNPPQTAIYLDYNASAPAWPEVIQGMSDVLAQGGNASSVHAYGRSARAEVERARVLVGRLAGAAADRVVLTGSGTEANNQALKCAAGEGVLVAAIEHESVLMSRPDAREIPVRADGTVDLDALDRLLTEDPGPSLVAVMLANNETGVIQPVAAVAEIARRHGARVHCDAVQAAGKIAVDIAALGVDTLSLSAHKIGGPQGVGALVLADGIEIGRFVDGGGQERGRRAGTENVAGIAGFGIAAETVTARAAEFSALAGLRDGLEQRLLEIVPTARVFGADAPRLPNTSKIEMPGVASHTQVMAMDLEGIAISAGSACSSGKVGVPYVLTAMSVPDDVAASAVRVSLGWGSTEEHVDRFVTAWRALFDRAGTRPGTPQEAA